MSGRTLVFLVLVLLMQVGQAGDLADNNSASAPASAAATQNEPQSRKLSLGGEIYEKATGLKGGADPTTLGLFNDLMNKAGKRVGAVKDYGKPRVVARGAKPEIIISGESIVVDGRRLRIGDSLETWKKALPGKPSCWGSDSVNCSWDQLGIQVGTYRNAPARVTGISILLSKKPADPYVALPRYSPNGKLVPSPIDRGPKHPFPGYFELDGHGIDAKSEFWEVRANADPKRKLRCGTIDCSHPHGGFSDKASLYLRLNSADEYGNVYEFVVTGGETDPSSPPKKN
jgi:hypothetical protein